MNLAHILDDLADHLRYRLEEGERWVEVAPDVVRALRAPAAGSRAGLPSDSSNLKAQSPAPPPQAALASLKSKRPPPDARFGATPELEAVAARIAACRQCRLGATRHCTVPGQGSPHPELVFVGEGPGFEEDRQGLAFIGPAGQLLTRLIVRMGFTRETVWIGNVVKCRATIGQQMQKDRPPDPDEMAACLPYLREQLALLRPKVIVALGGVAVKALLNTETGITKLRGQWSTFAGIDLMPTFHPSYLLRGGGDEKARYWEVWNDMEQVLRRLGRPVPERKKPEPQG